MTAQACCQSRDDRAAPSPENSNPFLSAKTRPSRSSKSRKDFLAVFAFENMEGGTYELFEL